MSVRAGARRLEIASPPGQGAAERVPEQEGAALDPAQDEELTERKSRSRAGARPRSHQSLDHGRDKPRPTALVHVPPERLHGQRMPPTLSSS